MSNPYKNAVAQEFKVIDNYAKDSKVIYPALLLTPEGAEEGILNLLYPCDCGEDICDGVSIILKSEGFTEEGNLELSGYYGDIIPITLIPDGQDFCILDQDSSTEIELQAQHSLDFDGPDSEEARIAGRQLYGNSAYVSWSNKMHKNEMRELGMEPDKVTDYPEVQ